MPTTTTLALFSINIILLYQCELTGSTALAGDEIVPLRPDETNLFLSLGLDKLFLITLVRLLKSREIRYVST